LEAQGMQPRDVPVYQAPTGGLRFGIGVPAGGVTKSIAMMAHERLLFTMAP